MNIEFRARTPEAEAAIANGDMQISVRVGQKNQETISLDEFCRRMSRLGQRLKLLHETVRNETDKLSEDHYL